MLKETISKSPRFLMAAGIAGGLVAIHFYLISLPDDATSPLAFLDRLFDCLVAILIALLSLGIGRILLCKIGWQPATFAEQVVFSFGCGAGVLSLVLVLTGFVSLLYVPVILGILVVGSVLTRGEWCAVFGEAQQVWRRRNPFSCAERWLLIALALIVLPVWLAALMPPTGADALAYHLVAPARFLKYHAVVPAFDNIGVNYPIAMDMLYLFGLAVGSDIAAQLVHFIFALAVTLGVYAFAALRFSRLVGLLAAVAFWTSSVIGLIASAPIIDLAWVFYELLALYAFILWRDSHQIQDLILSAAMSGLALSNKYLAVVGLGVLGLLFVIESVRAFSKRPIAVFKHALLFSAVAAIMAFPWYLKNWIWLGNPVYPFFTGSYGIYGTLQRPVGGEGGLDGWVGMGLGNDWRALLLFPWNVYINWQAFGTNRAGPSLFFLLLPVYLFLPKRSLIDWLLLICAVRFVVWWEYTQNIRYLLVIFPWLCVTSAYLVEKLAEKLNRATFRLALGFLVGFFCLIGIVLQWGFLLLLRESALSFLIGRSSRAAYLDANLLDYPVIRFMNNMLPPDSRVFAIGDWRGYYLQRSLIDDEGHDNWLTLLARDRAADGIAKTLRILEVTHLWVSEDDLVFFRNNWKLDGPFEENAQEFEQLRDRYLDRIYTDDRGHSVYALRDTVHP